MRRPLLSILALAAAWTSPAPGAAAGSLQAQPDQQTPASLNELRTRAETFLAEGRFAQAEPILLQMIASVQQSLGADHAETIEASNQLAALYFRQGRFAEGEPLLTELLQRSRRLLGSGHRTTLAIAANLAALYSAQYRDAQALALYETTVQAATASDLNRRDLVAMRADLANVRRYLGDLETAEGELRTLLADARANLGDDDAATLFVQSNLARVLQERAFEDRTLAAEAGRLFTAALEARTRLLGADHPDTLTSMSQLASFHAGEGRNREAEPYYQAALAGRRRVLGVAHPDTIDAAEDFTWNLLSYDLLSGGCNGMTPVACEDAANRAIEPATIMAEGIAARRRVSRAGLFGEAQDRRDQPSESAQFALYLDAARRYGGSGFATHAALLADVFAVMQRAESGESSLAVARAAARRLAASRGPGFVASLEEREALTGRWSELADRIADSFATGDTAADPAALADERSRIEQRIAALDSALASALPELAGLLSGEPLAIAAVQRLLGPDEALVLIQPAPFGTHIVAVTRDAARWEASPWDEQRIDRSVAYLRQVASGQGSQNAGVGSFPRRAAYVLHAQLFDDIAPLLAGKTHLFVAAGGALARLPFSLLVTREPEGADDNPAALRNTAWLAERFALVQIPSVQAFAELRSRPASVMTDADFVGFGDPALTGAASARGRGSVPVDAAQMIRPTLSRSGGLIADAEALRRLARLPGTADELNRMQKLFGAGHSRIFTGARATEAAVRAARLDRAQVLAFATHGLMPSAPAGDGEGRYASEIFALAEPGLVLTPPVEASETDDGYLAASEVAELRLDADWVILSACNTAAAEADEPGLSLLSRAFFYAGARSVLASHWPVADAIAPRLTVRTIELERGGLSRAVAFQRAMREVRMDPSADRAEISLAHPFYWAPFVLIGAR